MIRIEKIDAWLIARHQDLIDWSEKRKEWWVEQCAAAVLVGHIGQAVIRWSDPKEPGWLLCIQVVCALVLVAYLFAASRAPVYMAYMADAQSLRRFYLVITAIGALSELLSPSVATLHWIIGALGSTCCFYFAACQPPRPREPRRKLVPATN